MQRENPKSDNNKHYNDIPGGVKMFKYLFPEEAGRRVEKVWSLASTQALIEVQLRLHHYKQLHWRLVLPVLQAELRVLQHSRTWALLFHVCHRWQPERHIPASKFWKCVWLHEIFISFSCSPAMCVFIYQIFFFMIPTIGSERRCRGEEGLNSYYFSPSMQPPMGDEGEKIRGADHQNQGLFLI